MPLATYMKDISFNFLIRSLGFCSVPEFMPTTVIPSTFAHESWEWVHGPVLANEAPEEVSLGGHMTRSAP